MALSYRNLQIKEVNQNDKALFIFLYTILIIIICVYYTNLVFLYPRRCRPLIGKNIKANKFAAAVFR